MAVSARLLSCRNVPVPRVFLVVLGFFLSSFPDFARGLSCEEKSRVLQLAGLSRSEVRIARSRDGYMMRQCCPAAAPFASGMFI